MSRNLLLSGCARGGRRAINGNRHAHVHAQSICDSISSCYLVDELSLDALRRKSVIGSELAIWRPRDAENQVASDAAKIQTHTHTHRWEHFTYNTQNSIITIQVRLKDPTLFVHSRRRVDGMSDGECCRLEIWQTDARHTCPAVWAKNAAGQS